ncbi:MAG: HD domain-containing protein [Candidatus Spechtbacteria bacterium]|nr:HD domain-containing protein [Candidatus Spechtbacteria bacterium]
MQRLFPDSFYENVFGTITIKTNSAQIKNSEEKLKDNYGQLPTSLVTFSDIYGQLQTSLRTITDIKKSKNIELIEVTTFRKESGYSDRRHPDIVTFTDKIEEDLARRDFTINAMAMRLDGSIVDPYEGQKDLEDKIIRAVGNPDTRFQEDALRMMRAIRFFVTLDFAISDKTLNAIVTNKKLIMDISAERIRDELVKIINARRAQEGIELLQEVGLLKEILPELAAGFNVGQNKHHIYTVFEHNVRALGWCAKNNYEFHVRIASLLHDVGKPQTKRGDGVDSTFYGHEIVGARITRKALQRLKFPNEIIEKVWLLVRYHLFYYNVGEVTERSVRRLLAKVGPENINDLLQVRQADRIGSGVPKAMPYRLRHFQYMIEKVQKDPTSVKMLAVNGNDIMEQLHVEPGPLVGQILAILLDEVLDDPTRNTKEYLLNKAQKLSKLKPEELQNRRKESEEKQKQLDEEVHEEIRERYWVKE